MCSGQHATNSVGLHQGLQSLNDGGVSPKLLIIDDGWQATDIDSELREDVSKKLRLPEKNVELDETQGEFIEAELEMLQMSARSIPAGSALGESCLFDCVCFASSGWTCKERERERKEAKEK